MMKAIINWLKAAWLSFQVSQNARRLIFLRGLAANQGEDHPNHDQRVTLLTCCKIVDSYLAKHPHLNDNIFSLDRAQELLYETARLIGIIEAVVYGTD